MEEDSCIKRARENKQPQKILLAPLAGASPPSSNDKAAKEQTAEAKRSTARGCAGDLTREGGWDAAAVEQSLLSGQRERERRETEVHEPLTVGERGVHW